MGVATLRKNARALEFEFVAALPRKRSAARAVGSKFIT